jgi:mannose-6-phosphate isomerase-like protein (cupin superfamily)
MQVTMPAAQAKAWFGTLPPDLSVETRVRGTQWLYNYLIGFYRDPQSVTGWNNVVFPNVAMPHALWELSGSNRLVTQEFATRAEAEGAAIAAKALSVLEPGPDHKYLLKTREVDSPGAMSPTEYRAAVANAAVHETEAELFYVVDGSATLVTGGKLTNSNRTNAENLTGSGIEGGMSRRVAKGDFIMVPEGTPHWFSAIDGTVVLMSLHLPHSPKR